MAISTKSWSSSSVPTAGDFNRIENNIAELEKLMEPLIPVLPVERGGTGSSSIESARFALGLGHTNGPVPVNCGGTGAMTVEGARSALGLNGLTYFMPYQVSTNGGSATSASYSTTNYVTFEGVRVGDYVVCSACIEVSVSSDRWVRIESPRNIVAVVASPIKSSADYYAPECICYKSGKFAYVACDEGSSNGFMVTLTLSLS